MPYITESEYSEMQGKLLAAEYNEEKLAEERDQARKELQKQLDRNEKLEALIKKSSDMLGESELTCIGADIGYSYCKDCNGQKGCKRGELVNELKEALES